MPADGWNITSSTIRGRRSVAQWYELCLMGLRPLVQIPAGSPGTEGLVWCEWQVPQLWRLQWVIQNPPQENCRLSMEPGYFFLISRHIDKMYNRCWSLSRKSPWGGAWIYPPTSCPAFSWFTCHAQIAPYDQVTVLTATVLLCPGQIRTRIPPIREDVFRPLSHWHFHCFFFGLLSCLIGQNQKK